MATDLMHALHAAKQAVEREFSKASKVTPAQLYVLRAAAKSEGASQTALVAATGIDRSTTADIVKRLVYSGMLARQRTKEDERAYAVTTTPYGRKVLSEAAQAAEGLDATVIRRLSVTEAKCLMNALSKLAEPADAKERV